MHLFHLKLTLGLIPSCLVTYIKCGGLLTLYNRDQPENNGMDQKKHHRLRLIINVEKDTRTQVVARQ